MYNEIEVSKEPVSTELFRRSTASSKTIRWFLRRLVLPLTSSRLRDAYTEQFDDASRNVEIAVEGLFKLFNRHSFKGLAISRGVLHWWTTYFGAQRQATDRDRYLVYTQHDHRIPFVPDQDLLYAYMVTQVAFLASELAELLSHRELGKIARAFMDANEMGAEAFRLYPTTMPRFLDHDRLCLMVVQKLDAPLNCCPSLHITYSLLLDNTARWLGDRLTDRREMLESLRVSTQGMFNSVLYTKQHSLLDVAFGILCAGEIFRIHFGGGFDDLTHNFPSLSRHHPIPYDLIIEMLEEAQWHRQRNDSLASALGSYLQANGFKTVAPGEDLTGKCFHTGKQELTEAR